MDTNYFSKVRILDGGMGQELLARGLKARGTLWSATALLDKKYHKLVIDTHLDFIEAGADVIITNNFSARRLRLVENKSDKYFNYINEERENAYVSWFIFCGYNFIQYSSRIS